MGYEANLLRADEWNRRRAKERDMPNPKATPGQPAQPQQTQGTAGQGGQAAQFNPSALLQLFQDLQQSAPVVAPVLLKLFTDVVNVFKGQPQPAYAGAPVQCGPNGEKDKGRCCDALIESLTRSLALAVHMKCCQP
jgi:hypothetical protein